MERLTLIPREREHIPSPRLGLERATRATERKEKVKLCLGAGPGGGYKPVKRARMLRYRAQI